MRTVDYWILAGACVSVAGLAACLLALDAKLRRHISGCRGEQGGEGIGRSAG